jgi:cobalt/nickel transport protein
VRDNVKLFVIGGLMVAVGLGVFVSPFASSSPDGLERVAIDKGFIGSAEDHQFSDSPIADYAIDGVDNEKLSTGLSGLIGVLITFGVGLVAFGGLRMWRDRTQSNERGGSS